MSFRGSIHVEESEVYSRSQGKSSRTVLIDESSEAFSPTPVVYANQTAIALNNTALTITWKRKDGSAAEAALISGETVSDKALTVNKNNLSTSTSKQLTYIAYVSYADPDTGLTINATADITFAMLTTGEDTKSAWISGEQVFKYTAAGAVSPAQITLTANLQNVTMGKWQYKNSSGSWKDYPTTSDNASITSTTLIVKPTHSIFVGQSATLRITTSDDNIGDTTSIYKVQDGAPGGEGSPGQNASIVFLTNENITFAGNKDGKVAATTKTCNVVAYTGTTKVTPTVGTPTGISGVIDLADVEPIDPTSVEAVKTNIPDLDKALGGFGVSQVIVLSGRSGEGKSTLSGLILLNAIEQQWKCCAYSGELSKEKFQEWINLQAAGSEYITLKHSNTRGCDVPVVPYEVSRRIRDWYRGQFYVYDNDGFSEESEHARILRLFTASARRYGCRVFLVDNLMSSLADEEEEFRAQARFVNDLKKFAKRFGAVVMVVSHPRKTKKGESIEKADVSGASALCCCSANIHWISCRVKKKMMEMEQYRKTGIIA